MTKVKKKKSIILYILNVLILFAILFMVQDILEQYTKYPFIKAIEKRGIGILLKDNNENKLIVNIVKTARLSKNILLTGEHEPNVNRLINAITREEDKVASVGCNIGFNAIQISKKVGERGQVICLTKSNVTTDYLLYNIMLNKARNIIIFDNIISTKNTKQTNDTTRSMHNANEKNLIQLTNILSTISKLKLLKIEEDDVIEDILNAGTNIIKNSPDIIIIQQWNIPTNGDINKIEIYKNYLRFWKNNGFKIAIIGANEINEVSGEKLLSSTEGFSILITKKLDEIRKIDSEVR